MTRSRDEKPWEGPARRFMLGWSLFGVVALVAGVIYVFTALR